MKLVKNNSFVLILSFGISLLEYLWVIITFSEQLQIIRLTQVFALTALTYLYLALIAKPFHFIFKKNFLSIFQESIIAGAFYFGLLHALFAFFGQLGGFSGLLFLSQKYLLAITISFTALLFLAFLTVFYFTNLLRSFHGKLQKITNVFLYMVGVLVLIHALMLGTHFSDFFALTPQLVFLALAFLLILEGLRIDNYLNRKFGMTPKFSLASISAIVVIFAGALYLTGSPNTDRTGFGIHQQHIQLAKQAQQGGSSTAGSIAQIPGLKGDRTRRYTVSFNNPENVEPNRDVELSFHVYDAASGNKVRLFQKLNDKIVHFIIVDSELQFFNHIHPDQEDNKFRISTKFPKVGQYHLYLDFQPVGAIEQQMAFTLDVGNVEKSMVSQTQPDAKLTKTFGLYEVNLQYPRPLIASQLSIGKQLLTYTIKDAKTKKPVTTLKPYLAAFGHVVLINTKTFEYIHVHPNDLRVPRPGENGGPKVSFMPIGLYGPIKPGIYRVFAQFNPDNNLFTSDFTIEIK